MVSMEATRCWKNVPVQCMSRWQYRKYFRAMIAAQTRKQLQAALVSSHAQVKSLDVRLNSCPGGHGQGRLIDELEGMVEAAAVVSEDIPRGELFIMESGIPDADGGSTAQTMSCENMRNLGSRKHSRTKKRERTWRPRRSQTKGTQTDFLELSVDKSIQATMFAQKPGGGQTMAAEVQTDVTRGSWEPLPPQRCTRYFDISSDTEGPDSDNTGNGSSVALQPLAVGTRVRLKRDIEAWFNRHHTYYADKSWEGFVLETSWQDWDIEKLKQGFVYVQFRCPPGQRPTVSWWETLDGQGYFKPCGVKLWARMSDVEVLA